MLFMGRFAGGSIVSPTGWRSEFRIYGVVHHVHPCGGHQSWRTASPAMVHPMPRRFVRSENTDRRGATILDHCPCTKFRCRTVDPVFAGPTSEDAGHGAKPDRGRGSRSLHREFEIAHQLASLLPWSRTLILLMRMDKMQQRQILRLTVDSGPKFMSCC
jgi:hypothetical protein